MRLATGALDRIVLLASALSLACGPGPVTQNEDVRIVERGDFTFVLHGPISDHEVSLVADSLEANGPRILNHLRVAVMPHVRIQIWPSTHGMAWDSAMVTALGTVYPGATGYTPALDEMRLLYYSESPHESVHEYGHLVSMQVNPTIPNHPRWLWEAIATFEAGELDDPSTWSAADLSFPGFEALNQFGSRLPYRWGYLVSATVIQRWGDDGFLALIRSNGNTTETLGIGDSVLGAYVEQTARAYVTEGASVDPEGGE